MLGALTPIEEGGHFHQGLHLNGYVYIDKGHTVFHHRIDIMAPNGTDVFHRAGGQVVNVENYQPGNSLYWEWPSWTQMGISGNTTTSTRNTIPQFIKNKFASTGQRDGRFCDGGRVHRGHCVLDGGVVWEAI